MKSTDKKAHQQALVEFRAKHYEKEMETNLTVAKSIRDNESAKDQDRNKAIKVISRMLGGLQPDRTATATAKAGLATVSIEKPELPDTLKEKLRSLKASEVDSFPS